LYLYRLSVRWFILYSDGVII